MRCPARTTAAFGMGICFALLQIPLRVLAAGPIEIVGWSSQLVKQHPYPDVTGHLELVEYRDDLLLVGRVYAAFAGLFPTEMRHEYGVIIFRDGVVLPLLSAQPTFQHSAAIRAALVHSDRLYVAGIFVQAAGDTVSNVVAIDPLASDPIEVLGGGVDFPVGALGNFQGQVVAGALLRRGSTASDLLRVWSGSDWSAIDLPPGIELAEVRSLLEWNGELWVGGMFLADGEAPSEGRSVAIWNGVDWAWPGDGLRSDSGTVQDGLPDGLQGVSDLAVFGGSVYAAGSFHNESSGIWGAARFVGGNWEGLPARDADLRQILEFEDTIAFLGSGVRVLSGGAETSALCAWDGSSWLPLPGLQQPVIAPPLASDSGLVFDGALMLSDTTGRPSDDSFPFRLLRLVGSQWIDPWDNGGTDGQVEALLADGGGVVLAGQFELAGGVLTPMVARWDGSSFAEMSAGLVEPSQPVPEGGQQLIRYHGDILLAGGAFGLEGLGSQNIARWDGTRWQPLGEGLQSAPGEYVWISAVRIFEDKLVVGGIFDRSGSTEARGLAIWDGQNWSAWPVPFQATSIPNARWATPWVSALAVLDGQLWVGGYGLSVDGTTVRSLARWNQDHWVLEDLQAPLTVGRLVSANDRLFALIYDHETHRLDSGLSIVQPGSITPYPIQPPFSSRPRLDGQLEVGNEQWYVLNSRAYRYDGNQFEIVPGLPAGIQAAVAIRDRLYIGGWFGPDLDIPSEHFAIAELSESVPAFALTLSLEGDQDLWTLRVQWPPNQSVEQLMLEARGAFNSWRVQERQALAADAREGSFEVHRSEAGPRFYRAVATLNDQRIVSNEVEFSPELQGIPAQSYLARVAPNPFNPATRVDYSLARAGRVVIEVYAVDGRCVLREDLGPRNAGAQQWTWLGTDSKGRGVASGSYVLRVLAPDRTLNTRVMLLK